MSDKVVSAAFILGAVIIAMGASSHYRHLIWVGLAIQTAGWVRYFALTRRP
jgi:hypothetical protein